MVLCRYSSLAVSFWAHWHRTYRTCYTPRPYTTPHTAPRGLINSGEWCLAIVPVPICNLAVLWDGLSLHDPQKDGPEVNALLATECPGYQRLRAFLSNGAMLGFNLPVPAH